MPEINVNIVWVLLIAIPSILSTITTVKRMFKDSGTVDQEQNQAILLINAELKMHRSDIDRLSTRIDQADGRMTAEIKELEKKIDGRFDQVVQLITNALKK